MATKAQTDALHALAFGNMPKGEALVAALNAISRNDRGMPFNPGLYSAAPASSGGGGGFKSGVVKLGSTALKALSVPQAIAFTAAQKSGHYLSGGAVSDLSWKNLGGSFYKNYKGGGGLLSGFGVKNKQVLRWGGLGVDLLADPLWLVAPVKLAKSGGKAADAAFSTKKVKMSGAQLPKSKTTSLKINVPGGPNLMDEVVVKLAPKPRVRAKGRKPLTTKGSKAQAKRATVTQLQFKASIPALKSLASGGKFIDELGNHIDFGGDIVRQFQATAEAVGSAGGNWNVRFGTKKHHIDLKTPFKFKEKKLGQDGKVHAFKMSPEMKLGHSYRRTQEMMKGGLPAQMKEAARRQGVENADYRRLAMMEKTWDQGHKGRKAAAEILDGLGDEGARYRRWAQVQVDEMADLARHEGRLPDADLLRWKPDGTYDMKYPKPEVGQELPWAPGREATIDDVVRYEAAQGRADALIEYMPRGFTKETEHALKKAKEKLVDQGVLPGNYNLEQQFRMARDPRLGTTSNFSMGFTNPNRERTVGNVTEMMTHRTFMEQFDDPELARRLTKGWENTFAKADQTVTLGEKGRGVTVVLVPELDPLVTVTKRMQKGVDTIARREMQGAIEAHGIGGVVGQHLMSKVRHEMDPSSLAAQPWARKLRTGIAVLKATYTFVNPGHFFNNMWGDLRNANLNGNLRHLGAVTIPRDTMWKLANGDPSVMRKTFKVHGHEVLGEDLFALANLTGLGTGQARSEMLEIVGWLQSKDNVVGFLPKLGSKTVGAMARLNHRREAAQRFKTWLKHMQAGDDPMVAAEKMRRVHFDYSELTPFEENWARNAVLFYTWIKKNGLLHMSGPLTRPGFYNLINSTARAMPDMEGAPDWMREQTWVPFPGIGGFAFADPAQDIRKLELSGENLRQTFLAPITPPVRVPFELWANKSTFSNAPIDPGYPKQHLLARVFGGPMVQNRKDGPYAPGMDPRLAYLADQLTGPLGSLGGVANRPGSEKPLSMEVFGRWSGLKPFFATPEAWERARKAEENRKKREESLRRSRTKED